MSTNNTMREVEIDWECAAYYAAEDQGDFSQAKTTQAAQVQADELGEDWDIKIEILSGAAQDFALLRGPQDNIENFLADYLGYSASDIAWVTN